MYEVFINHHSLVISNYQEKEMDYLFHFDEPFSWSQLFTHLNDKNPLKFCVYADNCDLIGQVSSRISRLSKQQEDWL
jgi:hypothetical protein